MTFLVAAGDGVEFALVMRVSMTLVVMVVRSSSVSWSRSARREGHPPAAVATPPLVSHRPATAYSRDTGPVTTVSSATRVRWWRFVLAAVAAAIVALLGAGTASATTPSVAETRVGASTPATAYTVGVHESVSAGQRWGNAPPHAVSVVATGVAAKGAPQTLTNKAIGDAAADVIASQHPGALREVTLQATSGTRRLDVLTPQGLAIESKVGRPSLTKATRQQIQRDVELMNDPLSGVSSVEWHFGTSPVTGLGGPTGHLEAALRAAGIGIR